MKHRIAGFFVAVALLPGVAWGEEVSSEQDATAEVAAESEKAEKEDDSLPFGGSLALSTAVGMGTFANEDYARRPLSTGRLGLSVYYR